eukprot:g60863.t1
MSTRFLNCFRMTKGRGLSPCWQRARMATPSATPATAKPAVRARPFSVGDRVATGGKKGTVRYVGTPNFASGTWVGIQLDTPDGKNDGSIKGERYFECPPMYGTFAKPAMVKPLVRKVVPKASASPTPAAKPGAAVPSPGTQAAERPPSRVGLTASPSTRPASGGSPAATAPTKTSPAPAAKPAAKPGAKGAAPRPASGSSSSPSPQQQPVPAPSAAAAATGAPAAQVKAAQVAAPEAASRSAPTGPEAAQAKATPTAATVSAAAEPAPTVAAAPPAKAAQTTATAAAATAKAETTATTAVAPSTAATTAVGKSTATDRAAATEVAVDPDLPQGQSAESKGKQEHLESLQQRRAQLQAQDALTAGGLDASEKELNTLRRKLESTETELGRVNSKVSVLEQQNKSKETKIGELEEKVVNLEGMAEMLTLDLQVAQESAEELQAQLGSTQGELQASRAELKSVRDDLLLAMPKDQQETAKLVTQNKALADAVRQLRDINLQQKAQFERTKADLERKVQTLSQHAKDADQLKIQVQLARGQVKELKESLDEAEHSVDMVEQLSEKNLVLGERVDELEAIVKHQKTLQEASEEVEEGYRELERQLRDDLSNRDYDLVSINKKLQQEKEKVADLRNTVRQFRIQNRSLENALQELRAREARLDLVQEGEAKRKEQVHDQSIKLQQREREERKKKEFIEGYLPKKVKVNQQSLDLLLVAQRLIAKMELVVKLVDQFYGTDSPNSDEDLAVFAYGLSKRVVACCRSAEALRMHVHRCADEQMWKNASARWKDLLASEQTLDEFLGLLAQDTLTQKTSLANIVKAHEELDQYIFNFFGPSPQDLGGVPIAVVQQRLSSPPEAIALNLTTRSLACSLQATKVRLGEIGELVAAVSLEGEQMHKFQHTFGELEDLVESAYTLCQNIISESKEYGTYHDVHPQIPSEAAKLDKAVRPVADMAVKVFEDVSKLLLAVKTALPYETAKQLKVLSPNSSGEKPVAQEVIEQAKAIRAKVIDKLEPIFQARRTEHGALLNLKAVQRSLTETAKTLAVGLEEFKALPVSKTAESAISIWRRHQEDVRHELAIAARIQPDLVAAQALADQRTRKLGILKKDIAERQAKIDVLEGHLRQAQEKAKKIAELEVRVAGAEEKKEALENELKAVKDQLRVKEQEAQQRKILLRTLKKEMSLLKKQKLGGGTVGAGGATASYHQVTTLSNTLAAVRGQLVQATYKSEMDKLLSDLPPLPDVRRGRKVDWMVRPAETKDKEVKSSLLLDVKTAPAQDPENTLELFKAKYSKLRQRAQALVAPAELVDISGYGPSERKGEAKVRRTSPNGPWMAKLYKAQQLEKETLSLERQFQSLLKVQGGVRLAPPSTGSPPARAPHDPPDKKLVGVIQLPVNIAASSNAATSRQLIIGRDDLSRLHHIMIQGNESRNGRLRRGAAKGNFKA